MKNAHWFRELLWKSVVFALVMYGLFFSLRLGFVLYAGLSSSDASETSGLADSILAYFRAFFYGFLYDGKIVGIASLVYFVLGLFLCQLPTGRKVLRLFISLCVVLSVCVGVIEAGFYRVYGDTFNTTLFSTDSLSSFMLSLWSEHAPWKLFALLMGCLVFLGLMRMGFKIVEFLHTKRSYITFGSQRPTILQPTILLVCFISWEVFVLSDKRVKTLAQDFKAHTTEKILQKSLPGALRDLTQAYKIYRQIEHSAFSDYVEQTPIQALGEFFDISTNLEHYDLQTLLQKSVTNPSSTKIEHIFYIVVDGLNGWYCDKEFDEIEACSALKSLLSKGAFKANVFLQNASQAITNAQVQISGLFDIGIPLHLLSGQIQSFQTALATNFNSLGYKTSFFFGASAEHWQKFDEFVRAQGFSESFYDTHIVQNAKKRAYQSPYEHAQGAYNRHLLNFVRDKLFINYQQRSFNFILTAPYPKEESTPQDALTERIEVFLQANPQIAKHTDVPSLRYAYEQDKLVHKFIQDISARFPNTLFVLTANHSDSPPLSLKAKHSVPFILYAPSLQPITIANTGSHIDIMPTILELIAPDGHTYMSFGTPLLGNKHSIYQTDAHQAFGDDVVANNRFIYDGKQIEYFAQGLERDKDKELAQRVFRRLQQGRALSWWIFKNGYVIESQASIIESK